MQTVAAVPSGSRWSGSGSSGTAVKGIRLGTITVKLGTVLLVVLTIIITEAVVE